MMRESIDHNDFPGAIRIMIGKHNTKKEFIKDNATNIEAVHLNGQQDTTCGPNHGDPIPNKV